MASAAAAPRPPAPAPAPPPPPAAAVQWLGPRVSFSLDDAGGGGGREAAAAGGKAGPSACTGAGADFEFLLGGCAAACSMLPADELFSGGKLVPLRIQAPADETGAPVVEVGVEVTAQSTLLLLPKQEQLPPAPTPAQQPESPRAVGEAAVKGGAQAEPKIPARRWRDLLRLRKQQAAASSGPAAAEPRPLRRLLRRGPKPEPSLSLPLLREPGPEESETTKPADKSAPAPAPGQALAPPPSSSSQHQSLLPPKIRLTPSQQQQASVSMSSTTSQSPPPPPPPPPSAVAADSPRLNAAGKVVFNGLGRSSSNPSSLAGGRRHRNAGPGSGGMERSYSAHVRVAPVLNVPVCSLRGSRKSVSVFGIDRLFSPSGAAGSSSSSSSSAAGGGAARKNKAAKKDIPPAAAGSPPLVSECNELVCLNNARGLGS
ncbi:unnamed protein product [Miscanthus lutarioriparius]|uniref:Uncharacterized protein n=1 Tax=Miscanthus lutarioriparius TaxID=422564 RepID=A0A811RAE3_9POAL|nr:unnamed protein product [Miscanthus lutarioriparius]